MSTPIRSDGRFLTKDWVYNVCLYHHDTYLLLERYYVFHTLHNTQKKKTCFKRCPLSDDRTEGYQYCAPVSRTTAFRGKCFLETHSMYRILCLYSDIVRSHVLVAGHGQDPPGHGREIDRHYTGNMYLYVVGAHQQVCLMGCFRRFGWTIIFTQWSRETRWSVCSDLYCPS